MNYKICLFLLLALISLPNAAQEKKVTLSGYVTDAATRETLIGANVSAPEAKAGTATNNYGHYSLRLPIGQVRLHFNYVGYKRLDTLVTITSTSTLNIALQSADQELAEVTVIGSKVSEYHGLETGRMKLSMDELEHAPAIFGEPDLIKYAQLMPGVARGQEGFTGLVVRGGNADENLFLIDGNPMYNINHLFGIFSTFNPDAIKTANLYKGSFPARFGGRLSSVLDVRMKDGDMEKYSGTLSLGLISSRINIEGPIVKGKTSFSLSARRTYLDLLMKPIVNYANKTAREEAGDSYETQDYGYYFYDINFKVNHKFSDRDRIFLSSYIGDDVLDVGFSYWQRDSKRKPYMSNNTSTEMAWGSRLLSLGWSHLFSPSLFANTTLYYGTYRSVIDNTDESWVLNAEDKRTFDGRLKMNFSSGIRDFGLRADFDYHPDNKHYIRFGGNAIQHIFNPNAETRSYKGSDSNISLNGGNKKDKTSTVRATEVVLYAEDEIEWSDRFSTNIGAHFSALSVEGKQYFSAQPRISARYELSPTMSLKGSFAEMSQYVHLLQSTFISMPTDMWVPVTAKIRPMHSTQYSLGAYWDNREYEVSIEGYYKGLRHLIGYKDGASMFLTDQDWQERVAIGSGRAYGIETLLKKSTGRATGWISYTLSWADRIFPGGEINRGRRFRDKYDNRHKLNIAFQYKLTKNIHASATWSYSSGNRITLEQEDYLGPNHEVQAFYNERNNYQLPDYHRLDLGLTIYRPKKNGNTGIWSIGVYNAYSHHNSFYVETRSRQIQDPATKEMKEEKYLKSVSIFPFIPSVSYTYKF